MDESKLCLLDSARTACMHSQRWRMAYDKSLPGELRCESTGQSKVFHFANGSSTAESATVIMEDPGVLRQQKRPAEITEAMTALDMALHLRERQVIIKNLNLKLPVVD